MNNINNGMELDFNKEIVNDEINYLNIQKSPAMLRLEKICQFQPRRIYSIKQRQKKDKDKEK